MSNIMKHRMHNKMSILLFSLTFLVGCSGTIPKLGITNGLLTQCPDSPNCVSSQATDKDHFIEAINFNGTVEEAQARLSQLMKEWDRAEITRSQEDYLRVAFTSQILRFVDDVEFYFPATAQSKTDKTIIHFRSASRLGHSDLGVNRERMEQIRKEVNTPN